MTPLFISPLASQMPTQQVITLVLIAVAVVFVIAVYVHNRNRKYTDASLKKACEEFLTDLPDHSLTRKAFLNALKRNYNVGPKEALFLLGHAKKKGFITVNGDRVKLAETIQADIFTDETVRNKKNEDF